LALLALGSLAVLLDAGAKYSGEIWRAATVATEHAAVERDDSSEFAPYRFRLSATLPLDRAHERCTGDARRGDSASQSSDGSFDINCVAASTVKAVGDLRRAELLSWPGDSGYDRAVRF
jgi:hypothetical protein